MTFDRVAQPVDALHGGGVALACAADGSVTADALHGLFAGDTRVLSTYRITLGGVGVDLLSRVREGHGTAEFHFQNRQFRDAAGEVAAGSIRLSLRRRVDGSMHDDVTITSYAPRRVHATLVVQLDSDFADIFEVRSGHLPPRLAIRRAPTPSGVVLDYRRRGFQRALHVSVDGAPDRPYVVGSRLSFELELRHAESWCCCIDATPETDGDLVTFRGDPHAVEDPDELSVDVACDDLLATPFRRACADLRALTMTIDGATFLAAGVPWFLTLFGRDSLLASLMTGLTGSDDAAGALRAVGALQAVEVDDWRDAEPGKLPHELRRGELARRGRIPHTPYYGTHDAPALYCLTLWNVWRWTGDRALLDAHLTTAREALRWCDRFGDRDGDGLQEYGTRSHLGYHNHGWKDAGDAIVDIDGSVGELPLATVELQGYLYAARLAMSELFEALGDDDSAERERVAARELAAVVERSFFVEEEGFYVIALDGAKRPLVSITSNPCHLLWCGLPSVERARAVADRVLQPDMFSGWGLRTLSAGHVAYNPLSYQNGSVWPHDTVLAAAGLARYGHRDAAAQLIRSVLDAARAFDGDRLPELFCGFDRTSGPPVPYAEANAPQAWAAASPVLATQVLLGLVPDAPHGRCFLDPWLPDWLPSLDVRGVRIGDATLDITVHRDGWRTHVETDVAGAIEVVVGTAEAPLWGRPVDRRA